MELSTDLETPRIRVKAGAAVVSLMPQSTSWLWLSFHDAGVTLTRFWTTVTIATGEGPVQEYR